MRHLIYILFLFIFTYHHGFSQICVEIPREMNELPVSALSGYYCGFHLAIPGETTQDRADSCLAQLSDQFPQEIGSVELKNYKTFSTPWSQSVEYRQFVSDILIEGRGLSFEFDINGILTAIHIYFEHDEDVLDTLEILASSGNPETHTIQYSEGEYLLVPIQQHQEPEIPEVAFNADVTVVVTYPPYHTAFDCNGTDVSISVTDETSPLQVGQNNKFLGTYANSVISNDLVLSGVLNFDCGDTECEEDETHRHETLMSYYHLNYGLAYISEKLDLPILDILEFSVPGQGSTSFNEYFDGLQDLSSAYVTSGGFIGLGGNCNNAAYTDLAEDADYIISAAFASFIRTNDRFLPGGEENGEGVGIGLTAYWTWKYMKDKGVTDNNMEHTKIGALAGPNPEPIDVTSIDEEDEKLNYQYVLTSDELREKASIWAASLRDIFIDGLDEDEDLMNELLISLFSDWGNPNINQPQAAKMLHHKAHMMVLGSKISPEQFCEIESILLTRYPPNLIQLVDQRIDVVKKNFYIKDTRKDQIPGLSIGEDVGIEPNFASLIYDRSPSIWNCRSANCSQHEMPVFEFSNYLRVVVHNQGCDWSGITGNIEVYSSIAIMAQQWPLQWGGDINDDGVPDDYYVNINGQNVLIAKRVGVISLTNTSAYVENGQERIYNIPWDAWDPDPSNKTKLFHHVIAQGFLVRIVSPPNEDPITFEVAGNTLNYVRSNNNVAQRKVKIDPIWYMPPPTGLPPYSVIILHKFDSDDTYLKFQYLKFNHELTDSNFDSLGVVEIKFTNEVLETFENGLPEGSDHEWINDSTLVITGKDFRLPLNLEQGVLYPILVRYVPEGDFIPVSFHLGQIDDDGCYEGGQFFEITESFVTPRSSTETNNTEFDQVPNIRGYPNPAQDTYTINSTGGDKIVRIIVYNTMGEQVYVKGEGELQTILLTGWFEGLYYVQIHLQNGSTKILPFIHLNR